MIFAWFGQKALFGLARYAWIAIALALAAGAVLWATSRERADDTANQNIGAQGAVVAGQTQTLQQTKDAKDAEQELRAGGDRSELAYAECLRNARTKARCERYNPAVK